LEHLDHLPRLVRRGHVDDARNALHVGAEVAMAVALGGSLQAARIGRRRRVVRVVTFGREQARGG
jgi:hypothetical protein